MRLGVSATIVFLLFAVVLGTSRTASELLGQAAAQFDTLGGALRGLMAILSAALIIGGAWVVGSRQTPVRPALFLALLVSGTFVLRALLVNVVQPAWSTDYLRYWQHAVELAAQQQLRVPGIYHQRALLVPYPIVELFGPDATTALKWGNALLLLLVQLIAYDVMRLVRNHQAAQSASILLLALPMVAYSALIPSHDLWGMFFFSVATWAAVRAAFLRRNNARVALLGGLTVLCAVAVYCFELQRTLGMLYSLVLLLAAIAHFLLRRGEPSNVETKTRPDAIALLALASACFLIQFALAEAGTRAGIHATAKAGQSAQLSMKLAAHAGSMGTARSDWYARFRDRFKTDDGAAADVASDFSRSVALSTWVLQPEGKLESMYSHAGRLFDLGYPNDWDTVLRRPEGLSESTRASLLFHISVFGTLFGFTLLYALLRLASSRTPLAFPVLLGMLFVSALSLMLLAAFENKPSNIFPAWLVYCWLVAWVFSLRAAPRAVDSGLSAIGRCGGTLAVGTLALGAIGALAWGMPKLFYREDSGLVVGGWTTIVDQASPPPGKWRQGLQAQPTQAFLPQYYVDDRRSFVLRGATADGARIHQRADKLYTTLQLSVPIAAGDQASIEREICSLDARHGFEFFLFAPYQRAGVTEAFTVAVSVDDRVVRRVPIPYQDRRDTMQHIRVQDAVPRGAPNICHKIRITLESNVNRSAMSWQRASRVEIWFPRLVQTN